MLSINLLHNSIELDFTWDCCQDAAQVKPSSPPLPHPPPSEPNLFCRHAPIPPHASSHIQQPPASQRLVLHISQVSTASQRQPASQPASQGFAIVAGWLAGWLAEWLSGWLAPATDGNPWMAIPLWRHPPGSTLDQLDGVCLEPKWQRKE